MEELDQGSLQALLQDNVFDYGNQYAEKYTQAIIILLCSIYKLYNKPLSIHQDSSVSVLQCLISAHEQNPPMEQTGQTNEDEPRREEDQ